MEALLRHADASSFVITAIVRDAEKARKLEELGVNTVVGSHSDAKVVEPLAEKADVIITAANVDDMDAAHAILRGLKRKYEATSKAPLLIHTVRILLSCGLAQLILFSTVGHWYVNVVSKAS